MVHKAIEKQRENNITVWIPRKYHTRLRKASFKRGISLTYLLGEILENHFKKGAK